MNISIFFASPTFLCVALFYSACTYDIIVVINLCFSFSAGIPGLVLWCLLSPLFRPLNPQPVQADGRPSRVWFRQKFLPVKREFFLSTIASCMLRTGFGSKGCFNPICLFPKLGFFFNWFCMNWTNLEFRLDYDCSKINWINQTWIVIGLN